MINKKLKFGEKHERMAYSPIDDEIINTFFLSKPIRILEQINEFEGDRKPKISDITRMTDTTYAHTIKVLKKLYALKLVESEKRDRSKYLKLTDKGKKVLETFMKLKEV